MKLFITSILAFVFWGKMLIQDTTTITAIYKGFGESGYEFSFTSDEDGDESIYFETISEDILKQYNLKSFDFQGKKFNVEYATEETESEDEEMYTTYVLVSLKLVK